MSSLISIAPMMDWTDRHDRYFLRLIAPDVQLYTEMITAKALIHGDANRLLAFHATEKPVVLQLGGSEPKELAIAAKLGEEAGYTEINLNVGCPSPRVSSGRFGACLMFEPALVAECIAAMNQAVKIPVTVKCRIGVDEQDDETALHHFVALIASAGCQSFIVHARKAWLKGLSPKQNREVPPLRYDVVWRLKQKFPQLTISINGGIKTLADIEQHLKYVDGVMIGRAAYHNPYFLAAIQKNFFPGKKVLDRAQVIQQFLPYVEEQLNNGVRLTAITRHILGLFHGEPRAALWRRVISERAPKSVANTDIIKEALNLVINE